MSGTLHASKPDGQRRRRNKPTHDTRTLVRDEEIRGAPLDEAAGPAPVTDDGAWLPQVLAWWDTWRRSAQAQLFEDTDWQRLAMLAPLVQVYYFSPQTSTLAEIRLNEERLGATVTDRLRARMVITDGELATVTGLPSAIEGLAARMREAPAE